MLVDKVIRVVKLFASSQIQHVVINYYRVLGYSVAFWGLVNGVDVKLLVPSKDFRSRRPEAYKIYLRYWNYLKWLLKLKVNIGFPYKGKVADARRWRYEWWIAVCLLTHHTYAHKWLPCVALLRSFSMVRKWDWCQTLGAIQRLQKSPSRSIWILFKVLKLFKMTSEVESQMGWFITIYYPVYLTPARKLKTYTFLTMRNPY